MTQRRVVVTGMGMVSPLGHSVEETWKGLIRGKSGIGPISVFDAATFPVRIAGEVRGLDMNDLKRRYPELQAAWRGSFFALMAAEEAMASARMESYEPREFGLYFGAGDSGNDFLSFASTVAKAISDTGNGVNPALYIKNSQSLMNGLSELESQPFMTVTHLAERFGFRGPVSNCLTACAASSQAVGEAAEWIRRGDAEIVMTGGSHSMIHPLGVAGFALLTALSTRNEEPEKASRPFDKNRDGFVLAEGAAVLILEEREHALQRNAPIYGEIIGYGSTADAYRMTDMDPEGKGAARAMEQAMRKAGISPADVGYISAHGTGTVVNDSIETHVIKKVTGQAAKKIPVSSVKSMLGHSIAAAGAIELITCLLAMGEGIVPPTVNYEEPDPDCDLDYVPNRAREKSVHVALSNSFGFGGQNICLAVKKYEK